MTDESIDQLKNATALILEEVKTLEGVFECSELESYWQAAQNEEELVDVIVSNEKTGRAFVSGTDVTDMKPVFH